MDIATLLDELAPLLARRTAALAAGDATAEREAHDLAEGLITTACDEARADGQEYGELLGRRAAREAALEEDEGDGEPDVSDEGFDPFQNTYTDDC